jgi:hypothetical protein
MIGKHTMMMMQLLAFAELGNPKNLESFVKDSTVYTDDIVIVYVDLFDKPIEESLAAKVITVGPEFLIENGHSAILQLATDATKYDWVYFLHVGARIESFDLDFFKEHHRDYSVIRCQEFGYEYTTDGVSPVPITQSKDGKFISTKFMFHNKNLARWNGYVHEGVRVNTAIGSEELVLPISWYPVITWKRLNGVSSGSRYSWENQYYFDSEDEKIICDQYRKMTRTKWVALSKDQEFHGGQHIALAAYWEHKEAYELTGEALRSYLLVNDMNKYNEGM